MNDNSVSPVSGFITVLDWAEYHLVVIITPEEYGSYVAIMAAFPITDAPTKNVLPGKQPIRTGTRYHCGKLTDSIPSIGDRQSIGSPHMGTDKLTVARSPSSTMNPYHAMCNSKHTHHVA